MRRVIRPYEEMYLSGLSTRDIVKLLRDVSKTTVGQYLKSIGIIREKRAAAHTAGKRWKNPTSEHPRTTRIRARIMMEDHLGMSLPSSMCVHHIDGDHTNNTLSNLEVIPRGAHTIHHMKDRVVTKPEGWLPREQRPERIAYKKTYREARAHMWRKGGKYYSPENRHDKKA